MAPVVVMLVLVNGQWTRRAGEGVPEGGSAGTGLTHVVAEQSPAPVKD